MQLRMMELKEKTFSGLGEVLLRSKFDLWSVIKVSILTKQHEKRD